MDNPKHIAIVMDGNGRWAQRQNLARTKGHQQGLEAAKKIVKAASNLGIPFVTLYVFSTENWKRTAEEVSFLMGLIRKHLKAEFEFYAENKIKILHIGDLQGLPDGIQKDITEIKQKTAHFTGTALALAINYGGKSEIIRAFEKMRKCGNTAVTEESFSGYLDTNGMPPVDLFIRTGGERRLSNFLLWQSAYAELYFDDKLWPDWTEDDLKKAVDDYKNRDRRFGGVK